MSRRIGLVLVLCWVGLGASAEIGPLPPEPDDLYFTVLAQTPIATGDRFTFGYTVLTPKDYPAEVPELYVEVREMESMKTVARLAFLAEYENWPGSGTEDLKFKDGAAVEAIKKLAAGEYMMAVVHGDGRRLSNVETFRIDPEMDLSELPVMEPVVIAPPPYRDVPFIGLWLTGPEEGMVHLQSSDFHYPRLFVDEIEREVTLIVWGSMDPEFRPGDRWLIILDPMAFRTPAITGPVRSARVEVEGFSTETFSLAYDNRLTDRWDVAGVQAAP